MNIHNPTWIRFATLTAALLFQPALTASAQTSCANYSKVASAAGLYFPEKGEFFLYDSDGSQNVQVVNFGPRQSNLIALGGDWNHSGFDGIGYYDPDTATFSLKYQASSGPADLTFVYGWRQPGYVKPVAGDWTGKGYKSVGIYDSNGHFYLRNTNTSGNADIVLPVPLIPRALPVVGDWSGDGITRVGIYDPSTNTFYLRMTNDPSNNTTASVQLRPSDGWWTGGEPVVGKWLAGMAGDSLGLRNKNTVMLRDTLTSGHFDRAIDLAPVGSNAVQMVMGKWKPSRCLAAGQNTSPVAPPWMKDMILYGLRFETFTGGATNGTFRTAMDKLPYLANLGVTGIVASSAATLYNANVDVRAQSLYGPSFPDQLDPRIGTDADFAAFVAKAHSLGIKVFMDNVVHGIDKYSPYLPGPVEGVDYTKTPFKLDSRALPPEFFTHTPAGLIQRTWWGTAQWDWSSPALWSWWSSTIGVGWVKKYDIDGFRMDLEPNVAGQQVWNKIRADILAATGKQVALIPEIYYPCRGYTFDTTQVSDIGLGQKYDFFAGTANVVDTVKNLPEQFYTFYVSNHDNRDFAIKGRLGAMAYGGILSPFIPLWFAGEEFNASLHFVNAPWAKNLYFNMLNWNEQTANADFNAKVKRIIQIRKQYKNIIAPRDRPLNQANLAKVTSYSGTDLQPYTMWDGTTSITVAAKRMSPSGNVTLAVPIDSMGQSSYNYFNVTDLMNGTASLVTRPSVTAGLPVNIDQGGIAALKMTPVPLNSQITGNIDAVLPNGDGTYSVKGWSCSTGVEIPIRVHMYVGPDDKIYYTGGMSDLASEPAVASACRTSGKNYRFSLTLGQDAVQKYGGQLIFVHGISPIGGANFAINNPKKLRIPLSTTCGNGTTEGAEQCDAGTSNNLSCAATYGAPCQYCTTACMVQTVSMGYCGDGAKQSVEQCDNGASNGTPCMAGPNATCQYCSSSCTLQTAVGPAMCAASYRVTLDFAWNSLMRTRAIWATPAETTAPPLEGMAVTFARAMTLSSAGTYTITMAADDSATLAIDGQTACSSTGFATSSVCTVNLKAGNHVFTIKALNAPIGGTAWTNNPAGVAMTLTGPTGSVLLSTGLAASWASHVACPNGKTWDCAARQCR